MPPGAKPPSPHSHGRSDIWSRASLTRDIADSRRALGARFRQRRQQLALSLEEAAHRIGIHAKYLQRLETGAGNPSFATMVAIARAYDTDLAALLPGAAEPTETAFEVVPADEVVPYKNAVPLYALPVAAGAFAKHDAGLPEPSQWVRPAGKTEPGPGLFVARVFGESMNRRIPNGSYCLFKSPVVGSRERRILLVEHRDIADPDMGGPLTVKLWTTRKTARPDGALVTEEIHLLPASDDPSYQPIVLREVPEHEIAVVAELVEVLPRA